jgi:hypothetical protein
MGRLFVRVSLLRDREPLHTLAPIGFEGIVKANKYRPFSASKLAERGGNS